MHNFPHLEKLLLKKDGFVSSYLIPASNLRDLDAQLKTISFANAFAHKK